MTESEGGYDCDFTSELSEDLICSVCHFVVREPVQLESCGHRTCKTCFQQLKDHAKRKYVTFYHMQYFEIGITNVQVQRFLGIHSLFCCFYFLKYNLSVGYVWLRFFRSRSNLSIL